MSLEGNQNKNDFSIGNPKKSVLAASFFLIFSNENKRKEEVLLWLKKQKNKQGLFHEKLAINFLALSAIFQNDPDFFNGKVLGRLLDLLTFLEVQEGGPYYSQINQKPKIEFDSNVAIAYFLSLQEVELPNLIKLIDSAILEKNFSSKNYLNKYLTIYLISSFYRGKNKQELIQYLNQQKLFQKKDSLDASLIEKSLSNLNKELPVSKNKPGLILDQEEKRILEKILITAEKRFRNLPPIMKKVAKREIEKTILHNYDKQMFLMPLYLKQALGENGGSISEELIAEMGLANTFYWTAFIIYDDFWDEDETADPQTLPTANLYARHYCDYFSSLLSETVGFRKWFHELMDELDAANTWETMECRTKVSDGIFFIPKKIPDYKNYDLKYQPASGQVLSPVALFCLMGENLESSEVKNLISYFKNYLIAMQINDDAHDWREDMKRGHLSTVVVMMLEDWLNKYPQSKKIDLKKDKSKLEKIYWFKTIKRVCKTALIYTEKSRKSLTKITLIENPTPLERLIKINEEVAQKALREQKNSLDLIKEFN